MQQIYALVELARLDFMIYQTKKKVNIFDFYPDLHEKHAEIAVKYFGVHPTKEIIIMPELIKCVDGRGSSQPYIQKLLTYSEFERFEKELTFEEKVELAKDLLEIDMAYKAKQKELNEKGVYIHFHDIMSFHRKIMQGLTG